MRYKDKMVVSLFIVLYCSLNNLNAQVLVHQEPFHKPVFENSELRILNVVIPPGDTSLYHLHHTPSVFVFFTPTAAGTQLQGKGPVSIKFIAGRILFEDLAAPNTRIHRAWNEDKEDLHVMDVELLFKNSGFRSAPMTSPKFKLEVDTPWVRGYKLTLGNGEDVHLKNKKHSLLLVSLGAADVEVKQEGASKSDVLKAGSFYNVPRKRSFSIRNKTSSNIQFALLEWPNQN